MTLEPDQNIKKLVIAMNTLGENTRMQIAIYLIDNPRSVGEIANYLNISQPSVSHHLRILKDAKILKAIKVGKNIIYSLEDNHIKEMILIGLEHMNCKE